MSWAIINKRIQACKRRLTAEERLTCLKNLYNEAPDGMVAYSLGEELERQGEFKEALKYYEDAERRFPLPQFKLRAENAIVRVKTKIGKREEIRETTQSFQQLDLKLYNPETTLFVVACTRSKIWEIDSNASDYVPARFAYCGEQFTNFLKWAKKNDLEARGFKWIILSAKYGYIEPWHPISNYDVTFNDEKTGPVSDETLYRQVMFQKRWSTYPLKNFKTIICLGSNTYQEKVRKSFKDVKVQIISEYK